VNITSTLQNIDVEKTLQKRPMSAELQCLQNMQDIAIQHPEILIQHLFNIQEYQFLKVPSSP